MAGYRQFHTKFWKDGWVIELEPLERYLFTYLFTNEQSSISGIFELPFRIILNETGLDREFIQKTLDKFQRDKKIFYKDGIMWIVKMRQHHKNASPLTMKKVNADVDLIPDCDVKAAYKYHELTGKYCIDMVSIRTLLSKDKDKAKAEDKPKEEDEAEEPAADAPDPFDLIQRAMESRGILPTGENDVKAIIDLVNCGITADDVLAGIDWKAGNNGGKAVVYVSQVIGPAKTAMAKRMQQGFSPPKRKRVLKGANGETVEVEE